MSGWGHDGPMVKMKRRPNHAVTVGVLCLGASSWGILLPPAVTPSLLVCAVLFFAWGIVRAYRASDPQRGKVWALVGFILSVFFLGRIGLAPILDKATSHTVVVDGIKRTFRVRVPSSYDPSTPTPAILVFHGFAQTGRGIERLSRLSRHAEREGYLAVYPEGHRRSWNDGRSTAPNARVGVTPWACRSARACSRTVSGAPTNGPTNGTPSSTAGAKP